MVVGCRDENPLVAGRGITRLRRAGVRVDVGCLERGVPRRRTAPSSAGSRERRPLVTLKAAATLDGFIAPRQPRRRRAAPSTGSPDRPRAPAAHELRARHDAILVGAGTVLADDPQLTVRLPPGERPPRGRRCGWCWTASLRTPPGARLFCATRRHRRRW